MSPKDKASRAAGHVTIAVEECKGCGLCIDVCPPRVLRFSELFNRMGYHPAIYTGSDCTGCGVCFYVCPEPGAITVFKRVAVNAQLSLK